MKGGYTIFDFTGIPIPTTGQVLADPHWYERAERAILTGKPVMVQGLTLTSGNQKVTYASCMGAIWQSSSNPASGLAQIVINPVGAVLKININKEGYIALGK